MSSNVLIVGSGGREHAIAWKILKSRKLGKLFVAPGNGGTDELNVPIRSDDIPGLYQFARKNNCFTVVGPEAPLAAGIVDYFKRGGLRIFGPDVQQAMLETSKAYAKEFMISNGMPTAQFKTFEDEDTALDFASRFGGNVAVKADGLAAGKGVFVCNSMGQAEKAINAILKEKLFGDSGNRIVVEEKLEGTECSLMTICNGKNSIFFGTAIDHKRAFDGGRGPNTGGMGAYSPANNLNTDGIEDIMRNIAIPATRACEYCGFLYIGLMITSEGPKVLEFNARLGDPETQVILPRLKSDLLELLLEFESGADSAPDWLNDFCSTIVMCSEGYPQKSRTGDVIIGLDAVRRMEGVTVFHSGTVKRGNNYFTSGGRVLSVTGAAKTLNEALDRSYVAVSSINWSGEHHRVDIGKQVN